MATTGSHPRGPQKIELLAPAGDQAALQCALEAGADAVYFGLTVLNARRRAKNFTEEELESAVRTIHDHGARAYLTLNIDLAESELIQAATLLKLAADAGCDAVLVRDPALMALRPLFTNLEFHFSTQTSMTSSADVAAAASLGADRVVLARELTLEEIAAASAVASIATEVFVQGALCFSLSGRCLMSSWVGGRSGNRGACASPCRACWSPDGQGAQTPLAMHDLATWDRLDQLQEAGVRALKIEGRMKSASWVRQAVDVYRKVLDGTPSDQLADQVRQLGDYTGRQLTSDYLDGRRDHLTGTAGRKSSDDLAMPSDAVDQPPRTSQNVLTYDLEMHVADRGIDITCCCGPIQETWKIPQTVVRRRHKAQTIGDVFYRLEEEPIHGALLGKGQTNSLEFLLVPHAVNGLMRRIASVVQRHRRRQSRARKAVLPDEVRELLEEQTGCAANNHPLGSPPDRVRLDSNAVIQWAREVNDPAIEIIVEGAGEDQLAAIRAECRRQPLVAALPPVFFEDQISQLRSLVAYCARARIPVEVNSWGGWQLAKRKRLVVEGGPGLPVLNSLAARMLAKAGMRCVTLSPEADRRQLELVSDRSPVPCSLIVFGRPALMISRVEPPPEYVDQLLVDRRNTKVISRKEDGLWVLRPDEPFDWTGLDNPAIKVRHLVADLVGDPDPVRQWRRIGKGTRTAFHFNYDRGLP